MGDEVKQAQRCMRQQRVNYWSGECPPLPDERIERAIHNAEAIRACYAELPAQRDALLTKELHRATQAVRGNVFFGWATKSERQALLVRLRDQFNLVPEADLRHTARCRAAGVTVAHPPAPLAKLRDAVHTNAQRIATCIDTPDLQAQARAHDAAQATRVVSMYEDVSRATAGEILRRAGDAASDSRGVCLQQHTRWYEDSDFYQGLTERAYVNSIAIRTCYADQPTVRDALLIQEHRWANEFRAKNSRYQRDSPSEQAYTTASLEASFRVYADIEALRDSECLRSGYRAYLGEVLASRWSLTATLHNNGAVLRRCVSDPKLLATAMTREMQKVYTAILADGYRDIPEWAAEERFRAYLAGEPPPLQPPEPPEPPRAPLTEEQKAQAIGALFKLFGSAMCLGVTGVPGTVVGEPGAVWNACTFWW